MLNVGQTTTELTIEALQQIFLHEGRPDTIIPANGNQFVSKLFTIFIVS